MTKKMESVKKNKKEEKDLKRKQSLLDGYAMLSALKATHYNDSITDKETEKVLNEKVTAKDVMLLVEGMLAPVEGKIGEAYHSYMLHEYIIEDLAKKVFGNDVDMDKLYKDAEKKFNKQQKELKEKRKEILKKQIESIQKEMDK